MIKYLFESFHSGQIFLMPYVFLFIKLYLYVDLFDKLIPLFFFILLSYHLFGDFSRYRNYLILMRLPFSNPIHPFKLTLFASNVHWNFLFLNRTTDLI